MNVFSDLLDGFDECGRLIKKKKQNKSVLAMILIDALVDTYSQKYINQLIERKKQIILLDEGLLNTILKCISSRSIDEEIEADIRRRENDLARLRKDLENTKKETTSFDNRLSYLSKNGIVSEVISKSIRRLHEYRNQYLHRMKQKEDDAIAFAMLYFYLYQQLFIAIPINSMGGSDTENPLVKTVLKEQGFWFSTKEFRESLMELINEKYEISFSLDEFLKILTEFLMKKYEKIITAMHFLLEYSNDISKEIVFLETDMNLGKIEVQWIDPEEKKFNCFSSKTAKILGRIRKLSSVENEHDGLQKFVEILDGLETLGSSVIERYYEVDAYLEYQSELARGK